MMRRPWLRGAAWLLFLGPFFFFSYGWANHQAASRAVVGEVASIVFGWERTIPFLAWTIIPYWSIDLLYGMSFLVCRTRREVDRHALRLLTAQLIAVTCFVAFPLRHSFSRPGFTDVPGSLGTEQVWFTALYRALEGFDLPFNQAPSLHIALLVILWDAFTCRLDRHGILYWAISLWFVLVTVSVLTTFQHHFFDVPTGALLGWFCLWLWPKHYRYSPIYTLSRFLPGPDAVRIAAFYLVGAVACAAAGVRFGGIWLWLLWPSVSLTLVALNYFRFGPSGFQKHGACPGLAVRWLLAPYLAGAWLNARLWTYGFRNVDEIEAGVWLGCLPTRREMAVGRFAALVDLTAELCAPLGVWRHDSLPWLDLVAPDVGQLREAALAIEFQRRRCGGQPVLVCCALGYSRSACAVAAWLLATRRASGVAAAVAMLATRRPQIRLGPHHLAVLEAFYAVQAQNRLRSP